MCWVVVIITRPFSVYLDVSPKDMQKYINQRQFVKKKLTKEKQNKGQVNLKSLAAGRIVFRSYPTNRMFFFHNSAIFFQGSKETFHVIF